MVQMSTEVRQRLCGTEFVRHFPVKTQGISHRAVPWTSTIALCLQEPMPTETGSSVALAKSHG
jgi:hypothetical protein